MTTTQGQRQGERRRVRVRGRTRPVGSIPINRPIIEQPPVTASQCPELEGLQLYPDPTSCNTFYKVNQHIYIYIYIYIYILRSELEC